MKIDSLLDIDCVSVSSESSVHLLLRLVPESISEVQNLPQHICVALDRSSSMKGRTLRKAKEAIAAVLEKLSCVDQFSLVLFDHEAHINIPVATIQDKGMILDRVDKIQTRGGWTSIQAALRTGAEALQAVTPSNTIKHLLVITDGCANQGITDTEKLAELAWDIRKNTGFSISTVGLGFEFNEDLLAEIANHGSGCFYFLGDPDEAVTIIPQEIEAMREICSRNIVVNLQVDPHIMRIEQLTRHPGTVSNDLCRFELGDGRRGIAKELLLKLDLTPLLEPGSMELCHLAIEYLNEKGELVHSSRSPIVSSKELLHLAEPDWQVVRAINLQKSANTRRLAIRLLDRGDKELALLMLRRTAADLNHLHQEMGDDYLQREQQALDDQIARLERSDSPEHLAAFRKELTTDTTFLETGNFNRLTTIRVSRKDFIMKVFGKRVPAEVWGTDSMRINRSEIRQGLPRTSK